MEEIINIIGIVSIVFTIMTYFVGGFFGSFLLFFSLMLTGALYFSNQTMIIRVAFYFNIATLIIHYLLKLIL